MWDGVACLTPTPTCPECWLARPLAMYHWKKSFPSRTAYSPLAAAPHYLGASSPPSTVLASPALILVLSDPIHHTAERQLSSSLPPFTTYDSIVALS